MKLVLKNKIRFWIKRRIGKLNLIQNLYYDRSKYKTVLISYSIAAFKKNFQSSVFHTNVYEILEICNAFHENGYVIDIVSSDDLSTLDILSSKKYSVIFGFGDVFYEMTMLNPDAISILYMTENHPELSYVAEIERINYFYERHHKRVPSFRSNMYYKKSHLDKAYDNIIVLGEDFPYRSQYSKIFQIYPTGLINDSFCIHREKAISAKNNFLWLGSVGAVHKGLDLLIDIARKNADFILHVCGLTENDRKFLKINKMENIIDYGKISVNSELFLDICNKVAFVILPSCSEGFSTSIATGMLHGLIPVVTKNIGMNRLGDLAFFIDDYHVDNLEGLISDLMQVDNSYLKALGQRNYFFAKQNFSVEIYADRFNSILRTILE